LAAESQLRAEATWSGGNADPQTQESSRSIRYDQADMKLLPVQGATYRTDQSVVYHERHIFSWQDEKGQEFRFAMDLSPIKDFGFGSPAIVRDQPATLRWAGAPLGKGEVLVLLWENNVLHKTVPMELIAYGNEPAVEFPAAQISKLDPGQWTLYLVRKKLTKAEVGRVSVSGVIEYYTRTDTVLVR
jgi:hypothetical protein